MFSQFVNQMAEREGSQVDKQKIWWCKLNQ